MSARTNREHSQASMEETRSKKPERNKRQKAEDAAQQWTEAYPETVQQALAAAELNDKTKK